MMTAKSFNKAKLKDKEISKQQWNELVEILEEEYTIKSKGEEEIFLEVPKDKEADIEIYLIGSIGVHTFHVELWEFDLPERFKYLRFAQLDTLSAVIMHIDDILGAVKQIKNIS